MKSLFTTFLVFAFTISFSQELKKRQITPAQIDAVFSQWDTPDKPGIAVGVLSDGETIYKKGYGLANLEYQIPISSETKFHIGGIAKGFTVYSVLLLEQRGQLSLEDDIRKYIPKLKSLPRSISILQLLHHTSGLNSIQVLKTLAGWKPDDVFTKEQAYTMICNQAKIAANDANEQLFTEAGFMILEDLIAQIGKMPYSDFVKKEIFEPLEMKNTIFDTRGTIIPYKANGYLAKKDGFVNVTMNQNHSLISDVFTTVGDMCFWAKELGDPKIGTKSMMEKFDSLSVVKEEEIKESNMAYYTGGHRFWNFRGAKKLYHVEVGGGYASKLIRYPDFNLAVIIMGNDGVYNGYAATRASALYIEDFLDETPEESPKVTSKKLSKKELSAFEGDYWDVGSYSTRKIYMLNDTLRYSRGSGNESPLVPLTKSSFKMITGGDVAVNFNTKANPKTMDVTVGDDSFHLIAFDANPSWARDLEIFTGNYYAATLDAQYSLNINQGKLVITHPRLEAVHLSPRIQDVFTGDQRHFSSLTFDRDSNGTVKGFHLSTAGADDIWFQKEIVSNQNLAKTK